MKGSNRTQLESLFGVQDELRAHQLEIELFSLSLSNFESLEGDSMKMGNTFWPNLAMKT